MRGISAKNEALEALGVTKNTTRSAFTLHIQKFRQSANGAGNTSMDERIRLR
jgi:hypothetical protein